VNPLKYSYNNYIKTVGVRFENLLKEMAAEYNFDDGPEFEIAKAQDHSRWYRVFFGTMTRRFPRRVQ